MHLQTAHSCSFLWYCGVYFICKCGVTTLKLFLKKAIECMAFGELSKFVKGFSALFCDLYVSLNFNDWHHLLHGQNGNNRHIYHISLKMTTEHLSSRNKYEKYSLVSIDEKK